MKPLRLYLARNDRGIVKVGVTVSPASRIRCVRRTWDTTMRLALFTEPHNRAWDIETELIHEFAGSIAPEYGCREFFKIPYKMIEARLLELYTKTPQFYDYS